MVWSPDPKKFKKNKKKEVKSVKTRPAGGESAVDYSECNNEKNIIIIIK